ERDQKGCIVNVTSIAAHRGVWHCSTYSASKSAIDSYTKTMAVELSPKGIRVNAISPTLMITPMSQAFLEFDEGIEPGVIARTPQGKIAEVDDAVNAIVFLLSDTSDMINGHNLPVDGG
ncbi:NAD(P)-binding domain, partial [Trinorchestia longiramus]